MAVSTSYTRTKNSLRNSIVALSLQIISLLLGFWSRRIFLNHLGTEILGLNTTATSLLQFLNLAEMGIGSAIAVTLYRPIFVDDKKSIREIVALQGWLYKIIALIIMAGSIVLMLFFPAIFSKSALPSWYAYASFGVLLYGALLSYFFNYRQILLDAYQLTYKVQLADKLVFIIKTAVQALAIKYFDNGYIWWLALEVVFATITAVILSRTVNKTFPFIKEKVNNPKELRKKYPEVVSKVKQLFVHKIGGYVLSQATPLLIYGFATLTLVAKYGNYLIFTNNLTAILAACFIGLASSVGNMVAENNKELTVKVFRELFSVRFLMTMVCCICMWLLVDPFISLWIGPEYILGKTTLLLIVALFYIQNSRNVIDVFINAYGLFRDIWAPVAEAILDLGLAILFGKFYGLNGILFGTIAGEFLIFKLWKPYFLFRYGIDLPVSFYIKINLKHLLAGGAALAITYTLNSLVKIDPAASFLDFAVYGAIVFSVCTVSLFGILYLSERGMRTFIKRMLSATKSPRN